MLTGEPTIVIPKSNGHSDDRFDRSEERLIELMAAYHTALASGRPFDDVTDAAKLDTNGRAAFARAQRVLERLARVRPQLTGSDPTKSVASSNGVEPTNGRPVGVPHNDSATASDLPKNFGRFEIVAELGHGGLGVVFLARDPMLGRSVALKIPRPDALFTRDLRQRFSREAKAAARLTHPNLVPVYEIGEVGPICYIASAYCEGPNLASWLRNRGPSPPPKQAAWIVAALADAMNYAHSQGVLHRDLKPSNVLLEPRPAGTTANEVMSSPLPFTPRITDFGLAKINDVSGDDTRIGSMLGTPAYMAPEQADGRTNEIDCRTDVYGIGAILYELLVGRPPFVGKSEADTVQRVLTDDASFPRSQARCAPADLEAICLKCLEKKPSSRYASCAALADDLRRFLDGKPTRARSASPVERILKWSRRRPALAALVVVSILAAVTIVGGSALYARRLADALKASEQSRLAAVAAKTDSDNHRHYAEISRNEALSRARCQRRIPVRRTDASSLPASPARSPQPGHEFAGSV